MSFSIIALKTLPDRLREKTVKHKKFILLTIISWSNDKHHVITKSVPVISYWLLYMDIIPVS
jgi:hypothetical protein